MEISRPLHRKAKILWQLENLQNYKDLYGKPLERDWRAKRLLLIQILLIFNVHKRYKPENLHVSLFGTVLSISDNIMYYQWLISVFLKNMSHDQLLQKAYYCNWGLTIVKSVIFMLNWVLFRLTTEPVCHNFHFLNTTHILWIYLDPPPSMDNTLIPLPFTGSTHPNRAKAFWLSLRTSLFPFFLISSRLLIACSRIAWLLLTPW